MRRADLTFPDELKRLLFGRLPSLSEWHDVLHQSWFGEAEWAAQMGVCERRARVVIDSHRYTGPPACTIPIGERTDRQRREANSLKEQIAESRPVRGAFQSGFCFTQSVMVVLVWDIRFHSARRIRPLPICLNPRLAKDQWSAYRHSGISRMRSAARTRGWHGTRIWRNREIDAELREHEFVCASIGLQAGGPEQPMLIGLSKSHRVEHEDSTFLFATWTHVVVAHHRDSMDNWITLPRIPWQIRLGALTNAAGSVTADA